MVIPGLVAAYLVALPFIDRGPARDPRRRLPVLGLTSLGLLGILGLGTSSVMKDARDPGYQRHRVEVEKDAVRARALAAKGVLPEGGVAVYRNDPAFAVRELFREQCSNCHALTRQGGGDGPDLGDYNSRAWIRGFLENPQAPIYMGAAKKPAKGGMKPVKAPPEVLAALTEVIYAQTGAPDVDQELLRKGQALYPEQNCDSCHELEPGKEADGPNLSHRGSLEQVIAIIEDASRPTLYGERSKMPKFGSKLSREQIEGLARLVRGR
jgi:ubiquinol-cytochrome c reductase cytochrome b subunit